MMRRWTRQLRRWIRECFPAPQTARYEPRHLAIEAAEPEPLTGPVVMPWLLAERAPSGYALGSLYVYQAELEKLPEPSIGDDYDDEHALGEAEPEPGLGPYPSLGLFGDLFPVLAVDPGEAKLLGQEAWHCTWHDGGHDPGAVQDFIEAGWLAATPWIADGWRLAA